MKTVRKTRRKRDEMRPLRDWIFEATVSAGYTKDQAEKSLVFADTLYPTSGLDVRRKVPKELGQECYAAIRSDILTGDRRPYIRFLTRLVNYLDATTALN